MGQPGSQAATQENKGVKEVTVVTNTMESIRNLSSALWTIRTSQESAKILRTTYSLLRCFLFFDICYLIAGITLINQIAERERMVLCGGFFGLFASLSAMCNSLACHGMRKWKRGFLVPWILFYLLVLGFLTLNLLQALHIHNFHVKWRDLFLFFAVFTIFSCWRHMKKQYLLMALPRPEQVIIDVESVVREYMRPAAATSSSPPGDLPPKYEDLADCPPPQYDESTMRSDAALDTPEQDAAADENDENMRKDNKGQN